MRYSKHPMLVVIGFAVLLWSSFLFAEHVREREQGPPSESRQIREILALTYREGDTVSVMLEGTSRLPRASGEAKVERKKGTTEIEVELDEMKPATMFGGDYNTYVLWVVSPEGHVDNTGEFILQGNRSKLNVSTPLETFGMFVSAEPHFLVNAPSRFVVLENSRTTEEAPLLAVSRLRYLGHEGEYLFDNETLEAMPEAKREVRTHLSSARTAVLLAERAGAGRFAETELERARRALRETELAAAAGVEDGELMLHAHEAIRPAVSAEREARARAYEVALARERSANTDNLEKLRASLDAATTEADRARVEAERRKLEADMEARARETAQQEAEEARRRAEAAEKERERAESEKRRAEADRAEAERETVRSREEREEARRKLKLALEEVAEVRDTARGLIVDIPDVLFEFGDASITSEGREKLAKIAGILLVAGTYNLSVEGHTDDVGSAEYNLELSRSRAFSVRDYLISQGVSPGKITAKGLGESHPVASNVTGAGRKANRRVEIGLSEDMATRVGDKRR